MCDRADVILNGKQHTPATHRSFYVISRCSNGTRIYATAASSVLIYNVVLVKSCPQTCARGSVVPHEPRKHLRQRSAIRTRIEHRRVIELEEILRPVQCARLTPSLQQTVIDFSTRHQHQLQVMPARRPNTDPFHIYIYYTRTEKKSWLIVHAARSDRTLSPSCTCTAPLSL